MSETIINRANNFDPATYQPKEGELRLETQKLWFRLKHPTGRMVTRHLKLDDQLAIIEARIYLDNAGAEDSYIANSVGFAVRKQADLVGGYVKEAEDSAMTRALSTAGFGIQNTGFTVEPEAPKAKRSAKKAAASAVEESPAQEVKTEAEASEKAASEAEPVLKEEQPTTDKAPEAPPAEEAAAPAVEPAPAEEAKPVVTEIAPTGDGQPSVEEYKAKMSVTEAIGTVVEFGALKGKTLGQIVKEDPKQILWLRDSYKGPDNHLRAAAAYLLEQAGGKAA